MKTLTMFQNDKVEYPDSICSGGLGPCVAVAIYDRQGRNGYMIHQPQPDNDDDLEEFLRAAQQQCSEDVIICLAGAGYDEENEEDVKASRDFTEELVRQYFPNKPLHIKWTDDPSLGAAELILDTEKPNILVKGYRF